MYIDLKVRIRDPYPYPFKINMDRYRYTKLLSILSRMYAGSLTILYGTLVTGTVERAGPGAALPRVGPHQRQRRQTVHMHAVAAAVTHVTSVNAVHNAVAAAAAVAH